VVVPLLGQGAFRVPVIIDNVFTVKKIPASCPAGEGGMVEE